MGVRLKPCPFCGGEVIEYIGYGGMRRFWCKKCDAVVSFDNDYCNRNPESTYEYWNKRTEVDIVRCGECKHLKADGTCDIFADDNIRPSVSDFCSYGERRE